MKKDEKKKILLEILTDRIVNSAEFQDKFYLKEKILSVYPSKSDDDIYEVIEKIKDTHKKPLKKKDFIEYLEEAM